MNHASTSATAPAMTPTRTMPALASHHPTDRPGDIGCSSEQHEVVAVHDLALVRRTQLALEVVGGPAEQARDLLGVEVHQSAGDRPAVGIGQVDRVAGHEGAGDAGETGGEQRGAAL